MDKETEKDNIDYRLGNTMEDNIKILQRRFGEWLVYQAFLRRIKELGYERELTKKEKEKILEEIKREFTEEKI